MKLDTILPLLARDPVAGVDLAEIALLLAQEEYPEIDVEDTLAEHRSELKHRNQKERERFRRSR